MGKSEGAGGIVGATLASLVVMQRATLIVASLSGLLGGFAGLLTSLVVLLAGAGLAMSSGKWSLRLMGAFMASAGLSFFWSMIPDLSGLAVVVGALVLLAKYGKGKIPIVGGFISPLAEF